MMPAIYNPTLLGYACEKQKNQHKPIHLTYVEQVCIYMGGNRSALFCGMFADKHKAYTQEQHKRRSSY